MFGRSGEKHPIFGKKHTDDTIAKMSSSLSGEKNPMFGKKHTDDTRAKMSSSKGTPVNVLDLKANETIIYPSGKQAAKAISCSPTTFRNYLKSGKILREIYI